MAKVTLNLDAERISRRTYSCGANTRNGACPNSAQYAVRIGEYGTDDYLTFNLCRRHKRMYDEEVQRLIGIVRDEHASGLHGEGDDRKAFSEPHRRSEFFEVSCKPCRDEMASEGLGVPAEQVEQAQRIMNLRERHQKMMLGIMERFTQMAGDNGERLVDAITYYADSAAEAKAADDLWDRVAAFEAGAFASSEMNIVDAYMKVAEECKVRLINDRINSATERHVQAQFVNVADYTY